uniref:Methyltransferase domain-containing protein n=1 Tax=Scylla olivacea TaxID=85551 RepID=A0A0P4VW58_SCYOL
MQSHQYVHLSAASVQGWRNYTSQAVQLLDLNRNILDSYVLDFFTEDLWSRLNPKWTAVLDKFSPGDLASLLQNGASIKQESGWALSLLAFRAASHALSLPRKAVSSVNPLLHYLSQQVQTGSIKLNKPEYHEISRNVENKSEIECDTGTVQCEGHIKAAHKDVDKIDADFICITSWGDFDSELSAAAGQHKLLQHVFRRHLKPKKQHEVARLAIVAAQVARCVCDGVMVDVGSGQGHLSRLLAYGHDVRFVCLEAKDKFIDGARKFDHQLEKAVEKMTRKNTSLPPLPLDPGMLSATSSPTWTHTPSPRFDFLLSSSYHRGLARSSVKRGGVWPPGLAHVWGPGTNPAQNFYQHASVPGCGVCGVLLHEADHCQKH